MVYRKTIFLGKLAVFYSLRYENDRVSSAVVLLKISSIVNM